MAVPKRKNTYLKSHRNYKNMIIPKLFSTSKMALVSYNSNLKIYWYAYNKSKTEFKNMNIVFNFRKQFFI